MTVTAIDLTTDPQQAVDYINNHKHTEGLGAPVPTDGIEDLAITSDKMAPNSVTKEKIPDKEIGAVKLTQDLLDIINSGGSGGANAPGYFKMDTAFSTISQTAISTPNRLWLNVNKKGLVLETARTIDIATDTAWDTNATAWQESNNYSIDDTVYPAVKNGYVYRCTTAGASSALTPTFPTALGQTYQDGNVIWVCQLDFTQSANRNGKDYYIYACEPIVGTEPVITLSDNSTVPLRYTADNSRKIGGFHTLCVTVGTISEHMLSDFVAGDILPASVWDLNHRPKSEPEGMVYVNGIDLWVDIYLSSYTGTYSNLPENLKLVSTYNGVTADGASSEKFHQAKFTQLFGRQKKRLLWNHEFISASIGSNQGTNIYGSADANTTGGHKDTANRRMISNCGLEDCCGFLWQWGLDSGSAGGSAYGNGYDANDKYVGGQTYGPTNKPLMGGAWSNGAVCGSRSSSWTNGWLALYAYFGGRGASEPLRGAY